VHEAPPGAAVEVWASDAHRIGLKPILRRVWAPRGRRLVVTIHPRYRWRYLCAYVHPASGHTQWHLGSGSTVELCSRSLAAFAQQAGAGHGKELVLVVDQAGWHLSQRVVIPPHVHPAPRASRARASRALTSLHPSAAASGALVDRLEHPIDQSAPGGSGGAGHPPGGPLRSAADRSRPDSDQPVSDALSLVAC
jgi:hypothetical protein